MQDPIEEIHSRLSIEDVVQPYVQLKKAGRNFKACCPFHKEKTPSFVVSPEKQLAYCFGCHKGGDMFKFIQEVEGVDFKGSLEILADKAGIDLPKHSGGPKVSKDEKDTFADLQGSVADFYSNNLFDTKEGKKVLDYVKKRGIKEKSIKEWKIGFAPDKFEAAYKHLLDKDFKKSDAVKTGVLISKDTGGDKVYDRFRLRLIFPISDDRGNVVGFGGRALKKGDEPKYLNSPDSPVYNKSKILYGLNLSKDSIKEADLAIVVEGYMDVISSYQAGFKNIVASSGTALTVGQLKLLKRFTKNIAFCFDMDAAGQDALRRAIESAQPLDMNLKVILIPGYKDPDECVKDNPKKWKEAIENAKYYLDFYLEEGAEKYDFLDLEQSKDFCDFYLGVLNGVKHPLEQETYLNKLAQKVSVPAAELKERMGSLTKRTFKRIKSQEEPKTVSKKFSAAEYFLGLLWQYKKLFGDYVKEDYLYLFEDDLKNIYKRIASYYNTSACLDDGIVPRLEEGEKEKLEVYALYVENRVSEWKEDDLKVEMEKTFEKLKNDGLKRKQIELTSQIRQARMNDDTELENKLLAEYSQFIS